MTTPEHPEDLYRPPAPPAPVLPTAEEQDSVEVATVKRRSRVVVITVIAACATLLIGATVAIVMLTSGLLGMLGDRDDRPAPEKPAAVEPDQAEPGEAEDEPAGSDAECGELCIALSEEIGTVAGAWTVEGEWSDPAPVAFGATDAATAVFASDSGTAVLTVLQFDTDEQAAQAVVDMAARIGEPSFQTTVFDDDHGGGYGTRYDYDGSLTSRVLWHLDADSPDHAVGRLYLIEAPANDADDFSGQAAYKLYQALPL